MKTLYKIRELNETIEHCELMIKAEKLYSNSDKKLIKRLQAKKRRAQSKLESL